ncbi:NLI interacting factor-like phosphatase-domain-containing protein [Aspergillus pseudodeflectus]|uniref:NLI interacting factor-like phosphatase-domain-containing protein n=1 Tax=Aspergillus pseudodeflectus TaxID=176178 RepID=A0ABR4JM70_9EURO
MNSLNILSSRVIGQSSNPKRNRQRSRSQGDIAPVIAPGDLAKFRSYSESNFQATDANEKPNGDVSHTHDVDHDEHTLNEKTPLIRGLQKDQSLATSSSLGLIARRLLEAVTETIKFILETLAAPGVYVAQCFRDETGTYSAITPVRKLKRSISGSSADNPDTPSKTSTPTESKRRPSSTRKLRNHSSRESIASSTSESEGDRRAMKGLTSSRPRASKKTPNQDSLDGATPRRSIRIKLNNEEALQRQRQRRARSADLDHSSRSGSQDTLDPESLKSPPSSSVHRVTRYPHSPVPPRPLIPSRLPSYTATGRNAARLPQKTLVLDLDETLIHSLAKGGRMSSGHMVEVKLATPMTTALAPGAPPTTVGPQHPILYYVHKRPHCDDFLRKICKWYKLVVFTASVQEYADPVIDWLEQERKYFQARYYRQHCTFRNGAYIKDLSSVEPDLSQVMILDNSPMSYIFHEDNAIPIEGWINDPTDNGLLHLIPILEALQYVTDVRAFLALRRGEADAL